MNTFALIVGYGVIYFWASVAAFMLAAKATDVVADWWLKRKLRRDVCAIVKAVQQGVLTVNEARSLTAVPESPDGPHLRSVQ